MKKYLYAVAVAALLVAQPAGVYASTGCCSSAACCASGGGCCGK